MKKLRRMTYEEFCERARALVGDEYVFYPPFNNQKTPIKYYHKVCGTSDTIRPDNFLHGARCKHCAKLKRAKKRQLFESEFKKRLYKVHPDDSLKLLEPYHGLFKPTKFQCLLCGYGKDGKWTPLPCNLLAGKGCPNCAGNAPLGLEGAKDKIDKITDGQYELISGFGNVNSVVRIRHKKCNTVFPVIFYSFEAGTRCPYCYQSHGEESISNIMNSWNIKFIPQKRFKDCRDKRSLPFDFYLPDYNACIEYDGEQHFNRSSRYYSSKEKLHDHIKDVYCKTKGINLIRIPYTVYKETEIASFIKQRLFSNTQPFVQFKKITSKDALPFMLKYHYLHRRVATSYCYGLFANDKLAGIVTYTRPRLSLARSISDKAHRDNTLELSRLYIKDEVSQQVSNITSEFVSWSLRQLKKTQNWYIISFADSGMHHVGAIYQATNFLYCGKTSQYNEYAWNGYGKHGGHWEKGRYYRYMILSSFKYRYIKLIGSRSFKKHARRSLKLDVYPYPKGGNRHYRVGDTEERLIKDRKTGKIYKESELVQKLS